MGTLDQSQSKLVLEPHNVCAGRGRGRGRGRTLRDIREMAAKETSLITNIFDV